MWELSHLLEKSHPGEWGWVKWTFVSLLIAAFVGAMLKRRTKLHVALEVLAFLGLCYIFGHGVWKRGVLGTSVSAPHGWIYYSILIPHVTMGALYALTALTLFVTGIRIALFRTTRLLPWHRKLGWFALAALTISVVLSIPL